jgi:hypothetical protein
MLEPNREIWHIINRKDQKTFGDTGNPNKNRFTTALEKNLTNWLNFARKKHPVLKDLCSVESIVAAALWEKEKVRDILNVRTGQTGFRLQPPAKLLFPSARKNPKLVGGLK